MHNDKCKRQDIFQNVFLKNQRKFTFKESEKITKFELGGGLKLIIQKIKLCS